MKYEEEIIMGLALWSTESMERKETCVTTPVANSVIAGGG
jgi:hypothetical protein